VITTWGPGALIDLPRGSAIVGGLEHWPATSRLEQIDEPRLAGKISYLTGVSSARLYAPPAAPALPGEGLNPIGVWSFPRWFVVQEKREGSVTGQRERSRRLVHQKELDGRRFEGLEVVPTRFVRACPRGHVDDIDWQRFVHGRVESGEEPCRGRLWLDERGTGGDLADLVVRCGTCKEQRGLYEAAELDQIPLGICRGARPWLGNYAREECDLPARLLIRTAANAYFPQVLSALSLPRQADELDEIVSAQWQLLQIVTDAASLALVKRNPDVAEALAGRSDDEVLAAIERAKGGAAPERPVKEVEIEALLGAPKGFGDDVPIDPDFHARRLPDEYWRHDGDRFTRGITAVIQLHRLREVLALIGFSRFEAVMPDIHGELETDVSRAAIAQEPTWFPAIENRGEGLFLQLEPELVAEWLDRAAVVKRLEELAAGHERWAKERKSDRPFPGGPYLLLHSLSHLLLQSLAMRCGYAASSIRERVYADPGSGRYGILLYTASSDAEGTLGGLVGQARHMSAHMEAALRSGALCSNDPVCAEHEPASGMEERWLHGAACHGCSLISETSCEMRNDYLDRALVVPTLAVPDAAFFEAPW
jgi:hypothetical protein